MTNISTSTRGVLALLAASALLGLAGCSGGGTPEAAPTTAPPVEFAPVIMERFGWKVSLKRLNKVMFFILALGALLVMAGVSSSRRRIAIMAAGALTSAIAMAILLTPGDPTRVYYGTDTHAFGLLIGAALAVATSSQNTSKLASRWSGSVFPWRSDTAWTIVSSLAGIVILAAFFVMNDKDALAYKGGIFVICLATALLIAAAALGKGALIAPLSHPAMVWVGRRSYSMYLWHWPVFVIAGQLFDDNPERKMPFDMRSVMRAVADVDDEPLERWRHWRRGCPRPRTSTSSTTVRLRSSSPAWRWLRGRRCSSVAVS